MGVDAVHPSHNSQAVNPGQDAQGDRNSRREQQSKQPGKDRECPAEPRPVVNSLGQVTGRTIDTAA